MCVCAFIVHTGFNNCILYYVIMCLIVCVFVSVFECVSVCVCVCSVRLLCGAVRVCACACRGVLHNARARTVKGVCVCVRRRRRGRTAIIITLVNSHMFRVLIRLSMTCEESPSVEGWVGRGGGR